MTTEKNYKKSFINMALLIFSCSLKMFLIIIFIREDEYALVHIDLTKESEVEGVKIWLPCVKIGGVILIRNFERMHEEVEPLLIILTLSIRED